MNTPRQLERKEEFYKVFTKSKFNSAWKKHLRPALRSQSILDLHGYLDFHRYRYSLP